MEKETLNLLTTLETNAALLSQQPESREPSSTLNDDMEKTSSLPSHKKACIEALTALGKLDMTRSILGTTHAGKRLRALVKKDDCDPDVSRVARIVINRWKSMVLSESSSAPPVAIEQTGGSEPEKSREEVSTTQQTASSSPRSTRSYLTLTGDTIRDKIRNNMFDALCICREKEHVEVEGDPGKKEADLAGSIELSMYSSLDGVSAKYKAKFRQLYFNLKDPKNPDLRRKVVLGEYSPADLLTATPEDLASDAKKEENQRIRDKKLFDSAPSTAKRATTDQFQCGKCRQRKCTYYQMQTRSADEPMTTFVQCTNCNNAWKFC